MHCSLSLDVFPCEPEIRDRVSYIADIGNSSILFTHSTSTSIMVIYSKPIGFAKDDEDNDVDVSDVVLPFQKVNLTFKDMHYTVTASTSNEKLELLKGIDGFIEAGKMTALMGSSGAAELGLFSRAHFPCRCSLFILRYVGAGKTTLMDVLALRKVYLLYILQ